VDEDVAETAEAFQWSTRFPPSEETPSGRLIRASLERFARPRAEVESKIIRFLRQ
jgi:hypothetical protein